MNAASLPYAPDEIGVCFYRSNGLVGSLIRWQTRGPIGHVATYWPARGWWIEADVGKGDAAKRHPDDVGKRGVVRRLVERGDLVDVARVRLPWYEAAEAEALRRLGFGYDLRMIARFLTREKEANGTQNKDFCSENTGILLRVGGVVPLAHSEAWEESPSDLYKSPVLFPA